MLSVDEAGKTEDAAAAAVAVDEADASAGRKLTKAEKLEAKAARLREAEERAKAEAVNAPAATGSGSSRGWIIAVLGIIVVALAALSTALFVQLNHSRNSQHAAQRLDALRSSALAAARQDAALFSSFDYQNVQTNSAKVAAQLTPDFAKSYLSATGNLRTFIAQYKGKAVATVRGAAVSDVSSSGATVLLILDQSITTAQSPTPRIDRYRAQMTMQHQSNGTWLVSNLVLL